MSASAANAALRIRDYRVADAEVVNALVTGALAEHGLTVNALGIAEDLAQAHTRYAGPQAGFWVAELEGDVVGTVAIRPKEGDACELKRLYLRSDKRGAGIGQALYARAEAFAIAAGYRRIWLESSRRFTKARKLYERNGFVLLEELDNDWEDNLYEKPLP